LLATVIVCTLFQLIVGAPYAANERAVEASLGLRTAMRGLIVGVWVSIGQGASFLLVAPTMVRGGFHVRFLFAVPIMLCISVCMAFVPVDGSTLGCVSIALLTFVLGFVSVNVFISAPLFETDEHKALQRSIGPPFAGVALLFFALVSTYVALVQRHAQSALIGLCLPAGSTAARYLAIFALNRSCDTRYYAPKAHFFGAAATVPEQGRIVSSALR
jgi:hypothetical protein